MAEGHVQASAALWFALQHQPSAAAAAPAALHPDGGWTARFAWRAAHPAEPQAERPALPWQPTAQQLLDKGTQNDTSQL